MLKIAMTTPGMAIPHGGIRVIIEWANRLSVNHKVTLYCKKGKQIPSWIDIDRSIQLTDNHHDLKKCDLLIITSPHDICLSWTSGMPKRKVVFLQMLEHLFRPGDINWAGKCNRCYGDDHPLILISQWNKDYVERTFHNDNRTVHYIGNGVNFSHFPLDRKCKKDGKTILIEGWEATNPTKDIDRIAPSVAQKLRKAGYRILAYSQIPVSTLSAVPHEYYLRPSRERLNDLYARATVLLKASKYDARACAPMEVMTKGCITSRAIDLGDDDLIHGENCLRTTYTNTDEFYNNTMEILTNKGLQTRLRNNCYEYVEKYSWDYWMPKIEGILANV